MSVAESSHLSPVDWGDRQRRVVEADVTDNLLVDAGLGVEKTALACRFIRCVATFVLNIYEISRNASAAMRAPFSFALKRGYK